MRVLFVCLGNICRSPAAEGIFNHLLAVGGLEETISCDSAGTSGYNEGAKVYPKMKNLAAQRGYQLNSISRRIRPRTDFEEFDLIIGMDDQNIADLTRMAPASHLRFRIRKMTDYATKKKYANVPDPYYGETRDYELVLDILEDACEGLLKSITD